MSNVGPTVRLMTSPSELWIGARDAAPILHVTRRHVLRLADAGVFGKTRRVQVGPGDGMLQVRRKAVEAYAAKIAGQKAANS